jgi:hypothetical protein
MGFNLNPKNKQTDFLLANSSNYVFSNLWPLFMSTMDFGPVWCVSKVGYSILMVEGCSWLGCMQFCCVHPRVRIYADLIYNKGNNTPINPDLIISFAHIFPEAAWKLVRIWAWSITMSSMWKKNSKYKTWTKNKWEIIHINTHKDLKPEYTKFIIQSKMEEKQKKKKQTW